MILFQKKASNFYPVPLKNGILYLERDFKKRNGKLEYKSNSENLVLNEFDVANLYQASPYIICSQQNDLCEETFSYLVDDNLKIIQKLGKGNSFGSSCTNLFYYGTNVLGKGLYSLFNDELIFLSLPNENYTKDTVYDNNFFIELCNETFIIYIRNINTKASIEISIFDKIEIPLYIDGVKRFEFSKIYNNKLIISIGLLFIVIDCATGQILSSLKIEQVPRHFLFDPPFIYCQNYKEFSKFKIEDNNSITHLYTHNLKEIIKPVEGGPIMRIGHEDMWELCVYENKIYALNHRSPAFLLIHDAETGKRLQAIALKPFDIVEARDVKVIQNKIYITDFNGVTSVFEREEGE